MKNGNEAVLIHNRRTRIFLGCRHIYGFQRSAMGRRLQQFCIEHAWNPNVARVLSFSRHLFHSIQTGRRCSDDRKLGCRFQLRLLLQLAGNLLAFGKLCECNLPLFIRTGINRCRFRPSTGPCGTFNCSDAISSSMAFASAAADLTAGP